MQKGDNRRSTDTGWGLKGALSNAKDTIEDGGLRGGKLREKVTLLDRRVKFENGRSRETCFAAQSKNERRLKLRLEMGGSGKTSKQLKNSYKRGSGSYK